MSYGDQNYGGNAKLGQKMQTTSVRNEGVAMNPFDAPTPDVGHEVPCMLARINDSLMEQKQLLAEVEKRLAPVLNQRPSPETCNTGEEMATVIGSDLQTKWYHILNSNERLAQILNRLEV
jgi:hypothetical protein